MLLVGSHDNFLAINDYLSEQASRVADPGRLEARYRYWIGAMRSHERYEEVKLYPYLAHRFGVSFDDALSGHEELHERHDAVLAAFVAVSPHVSDASRAALVRALRAHRDTLYAHLQTEEAAVIPRLLDLSRVEFERYYALPIDVLLQATGS